MRVNEKELIMYPTLAVVGIEDRKEYIKIQTIRNEIVCTVCGMKYDKRIYMFCPLCESRKKNLELESYINNIDNAKDGGIRKSDKVIKGEIQGKNSSKIDTFNISKEKKEPKTNVELKRRDDARQAGAYNVVIMECVAKIKQDDYITDGYVSDLLKKNMIYNCGISIAEVRKDVAEYMKTNKSAEELGERGDTTDIANVVWKNKTGVRSKKISVNEFKNSIDYKIVVRRVYFKEKEDGDVSDDYILSELDKIGLDEKCAGKITIEDVRKDMWLIKKQQADKQAIDDTVIFRKKTNNESNDSGESKNVSQRQVKENEIGKQEVNKKTRKVEKRNKIIIAVESIIIITAAVLAYLIFYSSYVEAVDLVFLPKWAWVAMWILELIVVPLCVDYVIESNELGISVIYMCLQIITFYIAEVINGGPCHSVIVFIRLIVGAMLEVGVFAVVDFRLKHGKVKK